MLQVSRDCPFLIAPSVFSTVYLLIFTTWQIETTSILQERFEDIKGVIKSRKSNDRQRNGQKQKDKQSSIKLAQKT